MVQDATPVPGCTDANACNHDPAATSDDGSCEFQSCAGCTDANACNHDPAAAATINDGSCEYAPCDGDCTSASLVAGTAPICGGDCAPLLASLAGARTCFGYADDDATCTNAKGLNEEELENPSQPDRRIIEQDDLTPKQAPASSVQLV